MFSSLFTFASLAHPFSTEQRLDLPPHPQDVLRSSTAAAPADVPSASIVQAPASAALSVPASAPATAPTAPTSWQSEEARGYNELLDSFSLHQFIIRRGKTLSDTPEYESFKRKYLNAWGGVTGIVRALEKMLEEFTVPVAYIDGNRVVTLARDLIGPPSNDELLSCIVNIEQAICALITQPSFELTLSSGSALGETAWCSLQRQQRQGQRCSSNSVCL